MEIKDISIKDIKFRENIRQKNIDENIPELMASIKDNGLLQPIGIKEIESGYELIWGFRRLNACRKLGHKTIPAVIFVNKDEELTEEEFFVINATENLQRRQNSMQEFGRICKILRRTMSVSEIAKRLAVPTSRVNSALNEISRIPIKWQKRIRIMNGQKEKAGDIPLSTASRIVAFKGLTPQQRDELLEHTSRNDEGLVRLSYIASLIKSGKTVKEAVKQIDDYKPFSFKILINKKMLAEKMKGYESYIDYMADVLNRDAKNNNYVIKVGFLGDKPPQEDAKA